MANDPSPPLRTSLLSVSDKTGLVDLGRALLRRGFRLTASGGTARALRDASLSVVDVSEITGFPEFLGGRVKTLHPAIHGGILGRPSNPSDAADLARLGINAIEIVVCNLYPFEMTVARSDVAVTMEMAVEEIDIGGVTLLRAAAKNHAHVAIVCDPQDYTSLVAELDCGGNYPCAVSLATRRRLALKAFQHTASYDAAIAGYLQNAFDTARAPDPQIACSSSSSLLPPPPPPPPPLSLALRYGMNPHQPYACASMFAATSAPKAGQSAACALAASSLLGAQPLPFRVLNGAPGMINLLDALNAWGLVRELSKATGHPAATSFKHVSPAGAAIGILPFAHAEASALLLDAEDGALAPNKLSPLAVAYARARGSDAVSAFGDFAALSCECDEDTARLLSREVSDGVIAPSYSAAALRILSAKKQGRYCVLQIDPSFEPAELESRQVFGVTLTQTRNNGIVASEPAAAASYFNGNVCFPVSDNDAVCQLPASAVLDLTVATITAKYTMSNSVVFAHRGVAIGVGAGQQSRLHCTALAAGKADTWLLRQHPKALSAARALKPGVKRAQRASALAAFVQCHDGANEAGFDARSMVDASLFENNAIPPLLTIQDRGEWLAGFKDVALSSDAFFPFPDSLFRARASGVGFVAAPSGSVNDDAVVEAAKKLGMAFSFTAMRLFHH